MNKIIKTVKKEDKSFDSSALRRANANIEVYSPEELAHFGVMGMRWGVRNGGSGSGGSGSSGFQLRKSSPVGKVVGAANKVKDFKAAKKEMKAHKEQIMSAFAKKSDKELAIHEKEFKAKYGNQSLKTSLKNLGSKAAREANIKRANDYSNMLTKRMEKLLNDVAKENLAGTNYKITAVKGFNDFQPDFIITNGRDSVKHSDILEHADISWKMDVEWGDDGFVKSMNIPEDFLDIKDEEVAFVNMPDEDYGDDQDENEDGG